MPAKTGSILNDAAALRPPEKPQADGVALSGIGVSAGIAIGTVQTWSSSFQLEVKEEELSITEASEQVLRFRRAVDQSRSQLRELKTKMAGAATRPKDAEVLDAQLELLDDDFLSEEVSEKIVSQRFSAECVFVRTLNQYCEKLAALDNPMMRERAADLRDLGRRLVANLRNETLPDLSQLTLPRIIVAMDLAPADTAAMDRTKVLGFVTSMGSRTSHTAIMARSLGIPAVVGIGREIESLEDGDQVILDGARGVVVIRPTPEQIEEYAEKIRQENQWFELVKKDALLPSETLDGFHVQLAANLELPDEIPQIKANYGVGIGLFRTEFLFIQKAAIPSEDEQFEVYRRTVEEIYPRSVIFRTLDIGGDKFISGIPMGEELNPFLGMRAIRFSLSRQEVFMAQLRAILRASAYGKARIMFPMITTVDEVRSALLLLEKAKQDLSRAGVRYNPNLDVGIMIEVPSAALLADKLAPLVDFFSFGTNDLVQYSMAVDRVNPDLTSLYQPANPALVRLMSQVVEKAYACGKWVGICGEMASDPLMLPLILGCGIQELSMSPMALGKVKHLVRRIKMHEAEALVAKAKECSTDTEVKDLCRDYIRRIDADILQE